VRRHLTASQRAVVAFDLLPMLEKEAKQRQRLSNSYRGNGQSAPQGANQDGKGKASEMAARIAKASSRNVERVKVIGKQAPELIDEIRSGRVNVSDAQKLAELPDAQRARLLEQWSGNGDVFAHWKRAEKKTSPPKPVKRKARERKTRLAATKLICGDCRKELRKLRKGSVDLVLADPPYPETRKSYGKMAEAEWHEMMHDVVGQCRRVLKPHGSAVFVLQPNYEKVGKMRLWVWEFLLWAAREWNLVQDAYWWAIDTLPAAGTNRRQGLLRHSVKLCLWLGAPDCFRNQDAVLWEPSDGHAARKWSDRALKNRPSGHNVRDGRTVETSMERGGTTPFNLLPIPNVDTRGAEDHPATTPYDLAAWWCQYLLPPDGVLCDPFCGSGTMLQAGLDCGASRVIGIDKVRRYLATAKRRVGSS
jgi:DNA modification methylase